MFLGLLMILSGGCVCGALLAVRRLCHRRATKYRAWSRPLSWPSVMLPFNSHVRLLRLPMILNLLVCLTCSLHCRSIALVALLMFNMLFPMLDSCASCALQICIQYACIFLLTWYSVAPCNPRELWIWLICFHVRWYTRHLNQALLSLALVWLACISGY